MASFWSSASVNKFASNVEKAESKLLACAARYGRLTGSPNYFLDSEDHPDVECDIKAFDTHIPRSAVPLKEPWFNKNDKDNDLVIHAVHVKAKQDANSTARNRSAYPLVTLHGYFNGAAYYYRNLVGLSSRYFGSVFSLDLLGWGLSSRPKFDLKDQKIETVEDFFVESVEAWREQNKIEKMVLCGHSMGGYISVAYAEKYPQHVDRLLLLSPVGVPDEADPSVKERMKRLNSSLFFGILQTLFKFTTVGNFFRSISETRGYDLIESYIDGRLPEFNDPEEQTALADYLFYNAVSPGSGEYALNRILNSNVVAKRPLVDRIPNLKVKKISFLYGEYDWMDISGALTTQRKCESQPVGSSPEISVYMVRHAGHLLMLENWQQTTIGLIHAGGGSVPVEELPILLKPGKEAVADSYIKRKAREQRVYSRYHRNGPQITV